MKAKKLPESAVYEEGLNFWPYKTSLAMVLDHIADNAPRKGHLLDIMCGPGYLLGKIAQRRPDLRLMGVDIDKRYVSFGRKMHPGIEVKVGNVLRWQPGPMFDVVVCTGAVHHIPYLRQGQAVAGIAAMVKPGGFAVISDCYVDDYSSELERKVAAAKLGYEYLRETIQNGASNRVIAWTADILWNDVFKKEYKTSLTKRLPLLKKHFSKVTTRRAWPAKSSGYGDYIHLCAAA